MGKSSYYVFFDKNGKVINHSEKSYIGKFFSKIMGTELGEVLDVSKDSLEYNLLSNVMVRVPVWANVPDLFCDDFGLLCSFLPRGYGEIAKNLDSERMSVALWGLSSRARYSSLECQDSLYICNRLEECRKSTEVFDVIVSTETATWLSTMGKILWEGVAFLKKAGAVISNAEKELSNEQWLPLRACVRDEWRKINPYYGWFWDESGECRKNWDEVPVFCEEFYNNISKRISELKGNVHE